MNKYEYGQNALKVYSSCIVIMIRFKCNIGIRKNEIDQLPLLKILP